jgi:hypothetical protein
MHHSKNVDGSIEFNKSAFKHGITEEDIRYAFAHTINVFHAMKCRRNWRNYAEKQEE